LKYVALWMLVRLLANIIQILMSRSKIWSAKRTTMLSDRSIPSFSPSDRFAGMA
jgi:hypothetical protein